MGSWTDLTLTQATMQGIAPVDLTDPDTGLYDATRVSDNYLAQAKRYIEMRLMREATTFVERADGPIEFMDAALDIAKAYVTSHISTMLAYAFLVHYYDQEGISSRGTYYDRAITNQERFDMAFSAFINYIRQDPDFLDQAESTTDNSLARFRGPTFIG